MQGEAIRVQVEGYTIRCEKIEGSWTAYLEEDPDTLFVSGFETPGAAIECFVDLFLLLSSFGGEA